VRSEKAVTAITTPAAFMRRIFQGSAKPLLIHFAQEIYLGIERYKSHIEGEFEASLD